MRRLSITMLLAPAVLAGCAARVESSSRHGTLADLRSVSPDVDEAEVDEGLVHAMEGYRRFLEDSPETEMTPEAMRRLADLQIEKQFGIRESGSGLREPESSGPPIAPSPAVTIGAIRESDLEFERRTTAERGLPSGPASAEADPAAAVEAIALYDRLLTEYPGYADSDKVLYQKARAYDELGRSEEAMATMERLIRANPYSEHYDEVQFRRGEYLFTRRQYRDAENAYSAIIGLGEDSPYYELALYKLGWTLYKQELYEEALHRYIALLDYKVSVGYDFDQAQTEDDERRVADTYRAISLSFTNLGGPESVTGYFSEFGNRSYEDRVYSHLGEHYLDKLRYDDAARTYKAFIELYPFHRSSPTFAMRVIDTFTKGGFPMLVLEAKREFAAKYGLQSDYWRRFEPEDLPEVLAYLKSNLSDLATHYHAEYQNAEEASLKPESFREAGRWYREYLDSFPSDADTPAINYRFAELLLENGNFLEAAGQYERTAYNYDPHPQSAAAGYAAVFAYREELKIADEERQDAVRRDAVASSLRFVDAYPDHENAAAVLGRAADDLYGMEDYVSAIESAQRLIENYPGAEQAIRRSAWIVVAHGSFEVEEYPEAETAYEQVLTMTAADDESRESLIDNLAASIYRQGEIANQAGDYRAAADHFLRIRGAAPTSGIRATAEYDAGIALIRLEDWAGAASVLEGFRSAYPEHELQLEATRQIALAYREDGRLARSAEEYDRYASHAEDPQMRSEALLVAGDLYEQSGSPSRALDVYGRYVDEFRSPVEAALEVRSKIAGIHKDAGDEPPYLLELAEIVRIEGEAGAERSVRTRTIAARSGLVLAEQRYRECVDVKLLQPFEASLQRKQELMDATMEAMGGLVEYEIAEVTAAATYYMAETYFDFSKALAESERPADIDPSDMADYELALEEEAFPFEEKAIDLHEENLELLQAGVFNPWTEKSLGKLAELVPGRYAKYEQGIGFFAAIDTYVYRTPASEVTVPVLETPAMDNPAEPVLAARARAAEEED